MRSITYLALRFRIFSAIAETDDGVEEGVRLPKVNSKFRQHNAQGRHAYFMTRTAASLAAGFTLTLGWVAAASEDGKKKPCFCHYWRHLRAGQ